MISIIIPAHNEAKYIERCLESIRGQKYKDYEIIVVCDRCTDGTERIAQQYADKVFKVKKKNVAEVRNYGAAKAAGDILVFLDGDCTIAPNLLKEIDKTVKAGNVGGVTKTKSLENVTKANIIWNIGNFCRYFFIAASGMTFCTKKDFPQFDEKRALAEDTHLILKLKKKGKLKYITNSHIKTSARRMERDGYINTIYKQFKAFFIRDRKGY